MPHVDEQARREYHRRYSRAHYRANKARYYFASVAAKRRLRDKAYAAVLEYLIDHPCLDCGESDPIVLEFDHRDGVTKKFNIGDALRKGVSVQTLMTEIAKCDVRCANCHRRITYRRRGSTHKGVGTPPQPFLAAP